LMELCPKNYLECPLLWISKILNEFLGLISSIQKQFK
jgi:hypothetical protein